MVEQKEVPTYYAVCVMKEDQGSGVNGVVKFIQRHGEKVHIQAHLTGLAPGLHGFHVHEFGNLTNGCVTAGAHYNPNKLTHGAPTDEVRHVGDLGNIEAKEDGTGVLELEDHQIMIYGEVNSVIGRAMVVHKNVDDLGRGNDEESKKTGNAGARLACGVIGLSGPLEFTKL